MIEAEASPSFSSYSSSSNETLAEIAGRVIRQLQKEEREKEDDFEFSRDASVSADHVSRVTPTYPLFGRHFPRHDHHHDVTQTAPLPRRLPLMALMSEERQTVWSEEGGSYCVWSPRCKKSSSLGSNRRRWKLRDLLLTRCHSDGKGPTPLLFVGPFNSSG